MWPPRRSPSLSARSTFKRRPSGSRPSVVRASVSGETSAMNRTPAPRPGTARLAPLEAARRLDDAGEHALDDRLRAVEEAPEPRLALSRRQRFELAAVEPDAPARRTLVDGHVLIRDGREGLGATRTA